MAASDLGALLAAEALLNDALAELQSLTTLCPEDRQGLRDDLEAARSALRRCRRLGAALTDFVAVSLAAQGRAVSYDQHAAIDAGRTSWRA